MMIPENKAIWVDALRSGEYVQGSNVLCSATTGKMCCMGVAFDVLVDAMWHLAPRDRNDTEELYAICIKLPTGVYEETTELPLAILDDLGIPYEAQAKLMGMNDGSTEWAKKHGIITVEQVKKKSFKQIANWIDKNL